MDAANYEYVEVFLDSKDSVSKLDNGEQNQDVSLFRFDRPLENIVAFKVLEAEIPFSFIVTIPLSTPLLDNKLVLSEPTYGTQNVFLEYGNFTATDLATHLSSRLTIASSAMSGSVYTVTYDDRLGVFRIQTDIIANWAIGGMPLAIEQALGIKTILQPTTIGGKSARCPYPPQVTGPNYLYINSTKLGPVVSTTVPYGAPNGLGGGKGPQIAKVPLTENFWSVIFYQDPMPTRWFSTENLLNLDSLDIFCTLGRETVPIEFRNVPFSIKMGFLVVKPNNLIRM